MKSPTDFTRLTVAALLNRTSAFAAFKRGYKRSKMEHYSEFAQFLA
jgi:hypothetical protein